jgi:flagellar basal-body rod protein FlgB
MTANAGLMDLLIQKMNYLNQKQAVHAENIANSAMPGFKAREVAPFTFGDALRQTQVGMAVTDPRHIVPASMAGNNVATKVVKSYASSPNGNAVDLEQETTKSSKTNIEFQLVTTLYKHVTSMFRIALKGS